MATDTKKFPAGPIAVVLLLIAAASIAFGRFVYNGATVFHIATAVAASALTCLLFGGLFCAGSGKKRTVRVLAAALCPFIVLEGGLLLFSHITSKNLSAMIVVCVFWLFLLIVTVIALIKCAKGATKGAKAFIAIVLVLALVCSVLSAVATGLSYDFTDTQSSYLQRVAQVPFTNTREDALPQTAIYSIINGFLHEPLPAGKTEKKVIVIGYDGCREDIIAQADSPETSAILRLSQQGTGARGILQNGEDA